MLYPRIGSFTEWLVETDKNQIWLREIPRIPFGRRIYASALLVMPTPGYSTVRTLLATLEGKGYVRHEKDGAKFVFIPTVRRDKAAHSAISHLVRTFFNGSRGSAATALLNVSPSQFSKEELDELADIIERARKGATS